MGEPVFFDASLYENLIYGVKPGDADGALDRVQRICRKLRVSESTMEFLDAGNRHKFDQALDWGDILPLTQRALLNLARAFIANYEILMMHKPTLLLGEDLASRMFNILREFVDHKGVEMGEATVLRRPRTCIISACRIEGITSADLVFQVTKSGVFRTEPSEVDIASLA